MPGDVLLLEKGDVVGADAVIFEVDEPVQVNNQNFNGKDQLIDKSDKQTSSCEELSENVVFRGQILMEGKCRAIVVKTGEKTL